MGKRPIHPNQETILELPYSEVCMHLRVAGTRMRARLQPNGMVQLLDPDGRDFSFPITAAEAGLHHDQDGWSTRGHRPADSLDQLARRPGPPGGPGCSQRAAGHRRSPPLAWCGDRRPRRAAVLASHPRLPVGPRPRQPAVSPPERAVVWLRLARGGRRAVEVGIDPAQVDRALAKWQRLLGTAGPLEVNLYPARPDAGPPNPVFGLPELAG